MKQSVLTLVLFAVMAPTSVIAQKPSIDEIELQLQAKEAEQAALEEAARLAEAKRQQEETEKQAREARRRAIPPSGVYSASHVAPTQYRTCQYDQSTEIDVEVEHTESAEAMSVRQMVSEARTCWDYQLGREQTVSTRMEYLLSSDDLEVDEAGRGRARFVIDRVRCLAGCEDFSAARVEGRERTIEWRWRQPQDLLLFGGLALRRRP